LTSRHRSTPPRPRPIGYSTWLTAGFALVVLACVALLAVTVLTGPVAEMHHAVVTVDGTTIDRTALRARMTLDTEVQAAREALLRTADTAGQVTPEDLAALTQRIAADAEDPLRSAIDGLVRDQLIRTGARDAGLTTGVDVGAELRSAVTEPFGLRARIVTLALPYADSPSPSGDWPRPARTTATTNERAMATALAAERARSALEAGTAIGDITSGLQQAGWRVTGADRWLTLAGRVPNLPDGLLAALRDATPSSTTAIVTDAITGTTAIGTRLGDVVDGSTAAGMIDRTAIDAGALRAWAEARAADRALRAHFADGWASTPMGRLRVAELVVGPSDLQGAPGPYRSFAHLVIHQLAQPVRQAGETDDALANRLAGELRSLPPETRDHRFSDLVAAANATARTDPLTASGELGYFTKDQILPALADVAFGDEVETGAILGQTTTVVGSELFVLRNRFAGVLDDRSNAALVEAPLGILSIRASRMPHPADLVDSIQRTWHWRQEPERRSAGSEQRPDRPWAHGLRPLQDARVLAMRHPTSRSLQCMERRLSRVQMTRTT